MIGGIFIPFQGITRSTPFGGCLRDVRNRYGPELRAQRLTTWSTSVLATYTPAVNHLCMPEISAVYDWAHGNQKGPKCCPS